MKEKGLYYYKKFHIKEIIFIGLLFLGQIILYLISSKVNSNGHIINMKIDSLIPFCKYFIFFYFTYYWFVPLILWLLSYANPRKFYRLLIATAVTCIACNICFLIYQVQMVRPSINDNDIFSILVKFIYNSDPTAQNCCPSIHAVMGTLMIIGGYKTEKFPKWLKITSIVFGIGCIVSTVFVKQHYFIDMVLGVIFMSVFYALVLLIDKKIQKKRK